MSNKILCFTKYYSTNIIYIYIFMQIYIFVNTCMYYTSSKILYCTINLFDKTHEKLMKLSFEPMCVIIVQ